MLLDERGREVGQKGQQLMTKEDRKTLGKLWRHATKVCRNEPSPCLHAVHRAMLEAVSGDQPNLRPLRNVAQRIGAHQAFVTHRKILFPQVAGEWHITNADVALWDDLCLFGNRDYFPDCWHWMANDIESAICYKRRFQAYERYVAGGGINERHRRLLAGLIWDLDVRRGDWVSLYVQGKRPFGNSYRELDIFEIAGLDGEWGEDDDMPAEIKERCWDLFDELLFAVADALAFGGAAEAARKENHAQA